MPAFEYTGQLPQGTAITGTFEADNLDDARGQLADLAIHVSSVAQTPKVRSRRALSREDLLFFNQQLAALAENRIALDQGLRAVARDLRRGPLRDTIERVATSMENGATVDEAIEYQAGRFPPLYANVLRAGAANNELGATLLNFNQHLALLDSTRRVIWEAVTYPLIVLAMLGALATFFMLVVMPGYEDAVLGLVDIGSDYDTDLGVRPPWITTFIIQIARAWPTILMIAAAILVTLAAVYIILGRFSGGRRFREGIASVVPGVAGAYRASLVARFTNAAALAARSGQPLPALLRSAAGATGSAILIDDAERLAAAVEAGGAGTAPMVHTRLIPSLVAFTIHVAQFRGQIVEALADLARSYDAIARHKTAMLRVIVSPIVLLFVAAVMAFTVIALLLPLTSILRSLTGGSFL